MRGSVGDRSGGAGHPAKRSPAKRSARLALQPCGFSCGAFPAGLRLSPIGISPCVTPRPSAGQKCRRAGERALRYIPSAMAVPAMTGHGRDAPAPAGKMPALRATAAPVGASDASLRLRRAERRSAPSPLIFNLDSADNRCAEVWAAGAPAGRSFPHSEPRSGNDRRTRPAATYTGLDQCAVPRSSRERKFARFSA